MKHILKVLAFLTAYPVFAINPCNCHGYSGPGGSCYAGPGGGAYAGSGGPRYSGPGGPCYSRPGGTGKDCPNVCK